MRENSVSFNNQMDGWFQEACQKPPDKVGGAQSKHHEEEPNEQHRLAVERLVDDPWCSDKCKSTHQEGHESTHPSCCPEHRPRTLSRATGDDARRLLFEWLEEPRSQEETQGPEKTDRCVHLGTQIPGTDRDEGVRSQAIDRQPGTDGNRALGKAIEQAAHRRSLRVEPVGPLSTHLGSARRWLAHLRHAEAVEFCDLDEVPVLPGDLQVRVLLQAVLAEGHVHGVEGDKPPRQALT